MLPVIAIVGRPNVGKSTLFNRLTKSRDALVVNLPGVTRDRQYGSGKLGPKPYIVIDTGGIGEGEEGIDSPMTDQSKLAMAESDVILFVVDGRSGMCAADEQIAHYLRLLNKTIYLIVNKTDGIDAEIASSEFYALGLLTEPYSIAASHGRGVTSLMEMICEDFPEQVETEENLEEAGIKVAIIGKPNVGKSTLVNRMLGEERVIVYDQAGTTRDSIEIPFERHGQKYTLIDTAGIRRRGKITETVEKFSVVKALQAIESANVVLFIIDACENISDQDLSLLGFILDAGRSLVLGLNKWDGLEQEHKDDIKSEIERRLAFVDFAELRFISALHGTGVGELFPLINKAYDSAMQPLSTSELTEFLMLAVRANPPPLARGRSIKLRYANPGGHNPPIIVIHGNQTDRLPKSYQRYLVNYYRKALKLVGTPLRLVFKTSENPFAGLRNKLSPRQEEKRRRAKRKFKHK
jgi:GTP-binding protein